MNFCPCRVEFGLVGDADPRLEPLPEIRVSRYREELLPCMKDVPPAKQDPGDVNLDASVDLRPIKVGHDLPRDCFRRAQTMELEEVGDGRLRAA